MNTYSLSFFSVLSCNTGALHPFPHLLLKVLELVQRAWEAIHQKARHATFIHGIDQQVCNDYARTSKAYKTMRTGFHIIVINVPLSSIASQVCNDYARTSKAYKTMRTGFHIIVINMPLSSIASQVCKDDACACKAHKHVRAGCYGVVGGSQQVVMLGIFEQFNHQQL